MSHTHFLTFAVHISHTLSHTHPPPNSQLCKLMWKFQDISKTTEQSRLWGRTWKPGGAGRISCSYTVCLFVLSKYSFSKNLRFGEKRRQGRRGNREGQRAFRLAERMGLGGSGTPPTFPAQVKVQVHRTKERQSGKVEVEAATTSLCSSKSRH